MNKFNYIIRSPTTGVNNNINLRLTGLPSQYKYFDVTVQGFYCPKFKFQDATQNGLFAELKCFGLNIVNARDMSQNCQTVGITTTNNDYVSCPFTFQCENFNNQLLNFQLHNESGVAFTATAGAVTWVLVLQMEGISAENAI